MEDRRLMRAIQSNDVEWVQALLLDPTVDPAAHDNEPIVIAAENGYVEAVRLLLADSRVDPAANNNEAIRKAVRDGRTEVVRLLLQDKRINPGDQNNEAIRQATRRMLNFHISEADQFEYFEIIKLLAKDPRVDPTVDDNEIIVSAAAHNRTDLVQFLFSIPKVAVSAIDSYLRSIANGGSMGPLKNFARLVGASAYDQDHVVAWANITKAAKLNEIDRSAVPLAAGVHLVAPRAQAGARPEFKELMAAIENDDLPVVTKLIQVQGLDPTTNDYTAVQKAVRDGRTEIVRFFLQDRRVDPTFTNNFLVRLAAQNGHLEVVKLLVQDRRVDPSYDDLAIRAALRNGHTDIVRFLFSIPKVRLSLIESDLKQGHFDAIKRFALITGAVSDGDKDLLAWAAGAGSLPLVQYLVEQRQIDPSIDDNLALRSAEYYGQDDIVTYLMQFPGVGFEEEIEEIEEILDDDVPVGSDIAYITVEKYFGSPATADQFDAAVQSALEVAISDPLAYYMVYDQNEESTIMVNVLTNIIIHQTDQRNRTRTWGITDRNSYKSRIDTFTLFYQDLRTNYEAAVAEVQRRWLEHKNPNYFSDAPMLNALEHYVWRDITLPQIEPHRTKK